MSHNILRNGLFAAVTVAALGFGATQALAAPGARASRMACDAAADARCVTYCQSKHYDTGWCDPLWAGGCHCLNL
jgi:hypothetical protein